MFVLPGGFLPSPLHFCTKIIHFRRTWSHCTIFRALFIPRLEPFCSLQINKKIVTLGQELWVPDLRHCKGIWLVDITEPPGLKIRGVEQGVWLNCVAHLRHQKVLWPLPAMEIPVVLKQLRHLPFAFDAQKTGKYWWAQANEEEDRHFGTRICSLLLVFNVLNLQGAENSGLFPAKHLVESIECKCIYFKVGT